MKKEHEIFIEEMLEHGNKTLAYQKAFPNCNTLVSANSGGWRLMQMSHIKEALKHIITNDHVAKAEKNLVEKEIFARQFALCNDMKQAFEIAFPGQVYNASAATMLHRSRFIQDKIKELKAEADKLVIEELKQQRKFLFLSYAEKRDLLRRIVLGEETIQKRVREGGKWIMKDMPADMDDRLRAIDIDNRMTGEYAPDKLQVLQYSSITIEIKGDGWEAAA